MLHELLLALVGFTGDFVLDAGGPPPDAAALSAAGGRPTFQLAPDLTFLQPPERVAIERIISLGYYYRELNRFSTQSRDLSWIQSTVNSFRQGKAHKRSTYRRAVANGIAEILSIYRAAVLQVEQNLLADPLPILATVTQGLNKFEILLPGLYELIMEVELKDLKGGQLLNLLHKRCHCGVPELQSCFQRLLWHGHQVMYSQLTSWMVYGILHDPYGEFFIARQDDQNGIGSSHSDVLQRAVQKSVVDVSLSNWQSEFHVTLDMLPEYIHMKFAESILFAGKAIRVLRNPSAGFGLQDSVFPSQLQKGPQKVQQFLASFAPTNEMPNIFSLSAEDLFPQSEADKIDAMLQELKHSSQFQKRLFESAINSIRTIAANHLWQLVIIRADLNGHLKALKDYFLLAKGDFFQCFLEESRQLMRLPPHQSTAEADLLVPYQLAASKTIGEEDKYFSRVSLRIQFPQKVAINQKAFTDGASESMSQKDSNSETAIDGWDNISLGYSVDWPLQLFFTQEILMKYCKVFQYLIRLKRTQMELEKSWAAAMHQNHVDVADQRKIQDSHSSAELRQQFSRPMWRVREHMAFLIRNLQFYIQVDVIESQWNVLQANIQGSHDFTEVVSFHQEYLSALISQSFLDIGSLSRILDSIMKLCLQFCWSIEKYESSSDTSELDRIVEEFDKKSNSLYTILRSSRLPGSQRAPFLRQFLMRLNFNSFFEATARSSLFSSRQRAGA